MAILADDGRFKLRFERNRYKAGCRSLPYEAAVKHWTANTKLPDCSIGVAGCRCDVARRKRAELFIKAIKKHHRQSKKTSALKNRKRIAA